MKKACFVVGIVLIYLVLALTILTDKSIAQELKSCSGFMGYATDSADNNPIVVFSSTLAAYDCFLKTSLNITDTFEKNITVCKRVRVLEGDYCGGGSWYNVDRNNNPYCEQNQMPLSRCNRLCICEDLLKIEESCKGNKNCIEQTHKQCVLEPGFYDDQQRITPKDFSDIRDCIVNTSSVILKNLASQQAAASQTTYTENDLRQYIQDQCTTKFGTGTTAAANLTSCNSGAYQECVTNNKDLFKNNSTTVDQTQYDDFKTCISTHIAPPQTTYSASQLLTYAQGRCVANFGGGAGSTVDVNRCSADTYDQCGASVNSGKKLDDKSTLNQTQYDNYKICVDSTIAKKKSTTKKIITGSELYWEINSSTSKKISVSNVANVDLNQIDPSADIVGKDGKNYVMTLYLWFNGYSGECTDSTPITFCKIIRFTIHYTPAAFSTSGRSLEVGATCTPGTPKFVPESCTGRCKLAGCAEGKGEGSVKVCQGDGKSYGAAMGVCVQECGSQNPGKCKEDPAGLDVSNAPDCTYNEPCQGNGIKTCTKGKFINNKCIYVDGKTDCGDCKLPTKSGGCTLGAYDVRCKGECGGCNSDAGKAKVYQCSSSGEWEFKYEECNHKCAQYCGGATGPKEGSACSYPEQCPGGGVHTCTGTIQGGICKYNPGVDPTCTACR